jgi:anti-sigma regulatory factor (Ser/Thr protein kinase)
LEPLRREISPDTYYGVALVVSELVANAVQHGGADGEITVEIQRRSSVVKVRVCSPRGGTSPRLVDPGCRVDGSGGIGLHLVDRLAVAWGVDTQTRQTLVWADVAITDPS